MGRPDFSQITRQQRDIASFVGETALWRSFVSGGDVVNAQSMYGEANPFAYQTRVLTGLFRAPQFNEISVAGGQFFAGDVMATFVDTIPSARDRIVWRGVEYRVESEPVPQQIVGRSAYRMLLRRGDASA